MFDIIQKCWSRVTGFNWRRKDEPKCYVQDRKFSIKKVLYGIKKAREITSQLMVLTHNLPDTKISNVSLRVLRLSLNRCKKR